MGEKRLLSKVEEESGDLKMEVGNLQKSYQNQETSVERTRERYPKIVFLIILNEFCERFSYYGIRTVLFIYLTTFLKQSDDIATEIYHIFTVVCYFTPVFGAIIAGNLLQFSTRLIQFFIV